MPNERIAAALESWESRSPTNTRAHLARASGMSASYISALFKGRMHAEPETMGRILAAVDEQAACELLEAHLLDDVPEGFHERVRIVVRSLKEHSGASATPANEFEDNLAWLAARQRVDRQVVRWLNESVKLLRRGESKGSQDAAVKPKPGRDVE